MKFSLKSLSTSFFFFSFIFSAQTFAAADIHCEGNFEKSPNTYMKSLETSMSVSEDKLHGLSGSGRMDFSGTLHYFNFYLSSIVSAKWVPFEDFGHYSIRGDGLLRFDNALHEHIKSISLSPSMNAVLIKTDSASYFAYGCTYQDGFLNRLDEVLPGRSPTKMSY